MKTKVYSMKYLKLALIIIIGMLISLLVICFTGELQEKSEENYNTRSVQTYNGSNKVPGYPLKMFNFGSGWGSYNPEE